MRPTRPIAPLALLALLAAMLIFPRPTAAQESVVAATAPAPLDGAGSVVFISQSVDATLWRTDGGGYVVDARGAIRLHNTNRTASTTVTLGWPGWPGGPLRFSPAELPGFAPRRADVPLSTWQERRGTTWGGENRESDWLVTQLSIAPDTRERLTLNWRESLGDGPLLTYAFGLIPAGAWVGQVGSARVTLELPRFVSEEAIVSISPASYDFTGDTIEWLLVESEPAVNPTVTFIAPHVWTQVEQARAAAQSDPVGGNIQLAALYETLALAGATVYEPQVESALRAAIEAAPGQPEPRRRLAELLRRRAEASPDDVALLEEAVAQGEEALAAGEADPAFRAALVDDLVALAGAAREPAAALDYLARAEALAADPAALAAQRAALAERLALERLEAGDLWGAVELARANGLRTELGPIPYLTTAAVAIENGPGLRRVSLLASAPDGALVDGRMGALVAQINFAGLPASWDGERLVIEFPGDEAAWVRAGRTIAAQLPADPELDLLRDLLQPEIVQYRVIEGRLSSQFGYRERLRAETRAATLAADARAAAERMESRWERALLETIAARWQRLAESQEATVSTRFEVGQRARRDWSLAVPIDTTLEWRGEAPRRDQWLLAGGGVALALLLLTALIWLPTRRPRRRVIRRRRPEGEMP